MTDETVTTDEAVLTVGAGQSVNITLSVNVEAADDGKDVDPTEGDGQTATTEDVWPGTPGPDNPADTRSDGWLIGAGLLPNPNQTDWTAMKVGTSRRGWPLHSHYERMASDLAQEVVELREAYDAEHQRRLDLQAQAGKLHTAVRWLRDNTPQDAVSMRVIAYVLSDGDD